MRHCCPTFPAGNNRSGRAVALVASDEAKLNPQADFRRRQRPNLMKVGCLLGRSAARSSAVTRAGDVLDFRSLPPCATGRYLRRRDERRQAPTRRHNFQRTGTAANRPCSQCPGFLETVSQVGGESIHTTIYQRGTEGTVGTRRGVNHLPGKIGWERPWKHMEQGTRQP
jgi:hypothetical protein